MALPALVFIFLNYITSAYIPLRLCGTTIRRKHTNMFASIKQERLSEGREKPRGMAKQVALATMGLHHTEAS